MSSHNSKYYKKSPKRNKVVSHTLEKFLKRKRDDDKKLDSLPEKNCRYTKSQLPATENYTTSKR